MGQSWSMRSTVIVTVSILVAAGCTAADGSVSQNTTATSAVESTLGMPQLEDTSTSTIEATDPMPDYDFAAIGPIVDAFVTANELGGAGLAIVHRDYGIVHEQYWGNFDSDRISLVASSSKMVTAGVLLHLADAGLVDLDRPVIENLEGLVDWGDNNPQITPAQLLSGSSGLVGLGPDPGYGPYVCQFIHTGTLQECAERIFTTSDDDGDVVAPDTEFRYGGAAWQVAGAVAELVSGSSWEELIETVYVEPCELQGFGYNNHFTQIPGGFTYPPDFDGDPSILDTTANPNLEGGLYTTVPDYATLLMMLLGGGTCGDNEVLSQSAIEEMFRDRTGEVYDSSTGYGLGWFIDRASGRLSDPGAYGSVPWVDPTRTYGVVLVVEAISIVGNRLAAELYEPVDNAIASAS
jgi:CubicO group peptidase (beta-lactamase class C family)